MKKSKKWQKKYCQNYKRNFEYLTILQYIFYLYSNKKTLGFKLPGVFYMKVIICIAIKILNGVLYLHVIIISHCIEVVK